METRPIFKSELQGLLKLYEQLHDSFSDEADKELPKVWDQILADENHFIIAAVEDHTMLASCVLVIIPNLTHNHRPYALIENVITDEQHRGKGLATACLNYAKELAAQKGCYKIMLLTGSKKESTLNFYRKAGYNSEDKTAFIQWL